MNQLANQDLKGFWGRKKFIAIDLYQELGACGLPNKEKLEEAILRRFALANGTYRRTYDARFEEFDADAVRQAKKFLKPNELLRVHDVAVSDGRTACDFFEKLKRHFSKIHYHATDLYTEVRVINSREKPKNRIVKDEDGNLLQIIFPPFVFNVPEKDNLLLFPINRLLLKLLMNKDRRKKWMKLENAREQRMSIFSHNALRTEKREPGFSLGAYDIFNKMPAEYDIVRAMNVINKSYFNEEEAKVIIKNMEEALKDPGLLLIGSNKDAGSEVNGNIFLKKKGKMHMVSKTGHGAPYHEMLTQ